MFKSAGASAFVAVLIRTSFLFSSSPAVSCIGYPQNEDEYLTKDSEKFHQKLGYRLVGTFHDSGYKFGRWYDMIWMEKMLGEHTESPASVIPFSETEWAASHR